MTKTEIKKLNKFVKFTTWMCNDIERTMFNAKANFLVAQGLFNYTEIIGSFMLGQFAKDPLGNPRSDRRGTLIESSSTDRFNEFFKFMGKPYKSLITARRLKVYKELRCGLTHEYLIKKKRFCVYNPEKILDEIQMDNLKHPIDKTKIADCGVIHYKQSWHILNPKYYLDFKQAIARLINEIDTGSSIHLNNNFFERSNFVNLKAFK